MVYYRKYRPQRISELDLPKVREKLLAVMSSKELPHAFLFTGSKGLGKTSAARILAKAINCENRNQESRIKNHAIEKNSKKDHDSQFIIHNSSIEPCNKCEVCISITNGSNIDVLEIDAASNGGVEEIRALRERVKFASAGVKKKVYIIDEVHMLSTGAFNALLKTLEEPPSHVVFILATTELHKLPSTVVSRTFQVKFEKPTNEEIVVSLERIVKGEKLDIEKGVLEKIALSSDGAFRDAAKNLEELVMAASGKKITDKLFDEVFKTGNVGEEVLVLLEAYSKRDAKKALLSISKLANEGVDFKVVIERLVDHLRGLLMMRNGIESEEKDVTDLNMKNINELLKLSNEAYSELKLSAIPSLPLELMTVKYCILDAKDSMNDVGSLSADRVEASKSEPVINKEEKNISMTGAHVNQGKNVLKKLIEELNKINKPGAALLRSATSATIEGDSLKVLTPFPIHAERLKSDRVYDDLLKSAASIVGKKIELEVSITPVQKI